jgi:hypothetical protein
MVMLFVLGFGVAIANDVVLYFSHRKGYPSPLSKFLIILPIWLGFLGSLGVMIYAFLQDEPSAGYFILFVLVASLVQAAGIGLSYLVVNLLPKRRIRLTGSNRSNIPFRGIGYAIAVLGGTTALIMLLRYGMNASQALSCGTVLTLLVGWMFSLARRAQTPTAEEAMLRDRRPPLLYLRSFDQEGNPFAYVSREDAEKYSEVTRSSRAVAFNLTLEQFLAREIDRKVGPLIALGNPTDYLQPGGAARTYTADRGWQDYFIDLSSHSAAILMQMGNSDHLNWELASLRQRGLQNRLFVATPPPATLGQAGQSIFFVVHIANRLKGLQPASWDKFAANLKKAGYLADDQDPGSGVVVAFTADCRAVPLVSAVKTPAEYVDAICRRLSELPEVQSASEN